VSKLTLHRETGAESSLYGASRAEAARGIESFRMRVADDVQDARATRACHVSTMFDQQATDPLFPQARFDEQRIELRIPIRARHDCGKSHNHVVLLRHVDVTICQLLDRQ
jgi:hypothetical protein